MSHVELTNLQRQIVTVLANKYQQTGTPVKSQDLADALDRTTGTIRNNMQGLKDIGVVEGVPGRTGGYEPTETAFESLGREPFEETATVTLSKDFEQLTVTVDRITFPNITHPESCSAHVHCQQSVDQVGISDPVIVGPTPQSNLVVAGEVENVSETSDSILLDVAHLEAPLTEE